MEFDTKQTVGQFLLGMGALGIVLTYSAPGVATEMSSTEQQTVEFANGDRAFKVKQESSESSEFARYDSAKFSVNYPKEWQINPQGDSGVGIVGLVDGVNMAIRTDIIVLREDPQVAVPQRLDEIVAEALSVQRYSLVTVDGQSGFRIWYEPAIGQRALVTFVGYGNQQTAVLTSQYAPDTDAEPLVTQIHESFVNHSVAQAITPVTP
ncbi:MAG: hypothetical protein AAGA46_01215 [Cyanobacteria bacterium P01_F01_bin.13]